MPTHRAQDKDDEEIIVDGERVRVPLMLMCGERSRPAAHQFAMLSVFLQADPRPASYAEYDARVTNSWRGEERAVATPTDPPILPSDTPADAYAAYERYLNQAWRQR
jgi:hypothetical protein